MKKIIFFLLAASVIYCLPIGILSPKTPAKDFDKQVVTVHAGDTLWSVAGKYSGDTYILEYLEDLKALKENKEVLHPNRLLQPGDKITVLMAKGETE